MDPKAHPCIECRYYISPSIFLRIFRPANAYNERCGHPDARMEVDGAPTPCVIMRIYGCTGRGGGDSGTQNKFVPIE
jgi:hypothetical protein